MTVPNAFCSLMYGEFVFYQIKAHSACRLKIFVMIPKQRLGTITSSIEYFQVCLLMLKALFYNVSTLKKSDLHSPT